MSKEKVFIVMSHKHSLKPGRIRNLTTDDWQVTETVEFVNQLRNKHIQTSSVIADYINRKIISGSKYNVTDYGKFEDLVRTKYAKQLAELDTVYREHQVPLEVVENSTPAFSDQFGNVRAKTVFDV